MQSVVMAEKLADGMPDMTAWAESVTLEIVPQKAVFVLSMPETTQYWKRAISFPASTAVEVNAPDGHVTVVLALDHEQLLTCRTFHVA
jgi:hypothetical protein